MDDFDSMKKHIDEIKNEMGKSFVKIKEILDGDDFSVIRFQYGSEKIEKTFEIMAIFKIKNNKCSAFIESLTVK